MRGHSCQSSNLNSCSPRSPSDHYSLPYIGAFFTAAIAWLQSATSSWEDEHIFTKQKKINMTQLLPVSGPHMAAFRRALSAAEGQLPISPWASFINQLPNSISFCHSLQLCKKRMGEDFDDWKLPCV